MIDPHHANSHETRLAARELAVGYNDRLVIDNLDIEIPDGQVTTIVGANGCGKSTLLRALSRLLSPMSGIVSLDGSDIATHRPRELAQTLGLLPQNPIAPDGLSVRDLVSRGRHPHQRWYSQASTADEQAVDSAMERTGITALADRGVNTLSGGQRQRVWIALILAQQTDLLLLDEPTTYLDLAHVIEVLTLIRRLSTAHGKTVVMVLHDLNLAVRYSDSIVVMAEGNIVTHGAPSEVITPAVLHQAFGLDAMVIADPVTDGPLIVPMAQ